MIVGFEQVGVVVVTEKTVVSGLAKLAERHHWPLIHLPTAKEVMKTIGRQRIDVAVIHIAVDVQQTIEFIEWLRMTRREVLLVAVASAHQEEAERLVRHAGANCYLPQADEISLERAIVGILQQEVSRAARKQGTNNAHDGLPHRGVSDAVSRQGA